MFASGEQYLAVVRKHDCAAVVLLVGIAGVLVQDELAARNGCGACGVGGEPRQAIAVVPTGGGRVEDVIVVIRHVVRVEREIENALLDFAQVSDIRDVEKQIGTSRRVRWREDLDLSSQL